MRNQQTRREAGEQESLHQQRDHDYWLQQILCKSVKTRVNKSENQGPSLGARWTGIAILQSIQSPFLWAVSEQWVAGSRTGLNEWSRNQSLKPSWVKLQFSSVTSRPPLIRSSMYLPSFFYFFPSSSQSDFTCDPFQTRVKVSEILNGGVISTTVRPTWCLIWVQRTIYFCCW